LYSLGELSMNAPSPSAAALARAGLKNLRVLTLLLALTLAWSFALAPVAIAATAPAPPSMRPAFAMPNPAQIGQMLRENQQRRERQALIQQEMLAAITAPGDARPLPAGFHPAPRAAITDPLSLLDQVGNPAYPISAADEKAWVQALHTGIQHTGMLQTGTLYTGMQHSGRLLPAEAARLHLHLGEALLGRDKQPEEADRQFALAERLVSPSSPVYGRAAYDSVLTLFYRGAYAEAANGFLRLLSHPHLTGFERRDCALWMRHASACAGYHQQRANKGIPEPPQLDPLCGAASLASSLRALGLPSDRHTVVQVVRPTGEGSTLTDLVAAGPRLGASVRCVSADDHGLMELPKPVIAFVEHDHFISVIQADAQGVSYLCSDCGPWPGGRVDLTWSQWHLLEPGEYAAVTHPGGVWDRALASLGTKTTAASLARVSFIGKMSSLRLPLRVQVSSLRAILSGHVMTSQTGPVTCGSKPTGLPCPPPVQCPMSCPFHPQGPGPKSGDPVNLATGEEEYQPDADMTVYNPVGPSVTWQREYRSLRGPSYSDHAYEADDFGVGWSQGYNMGVTNPNASLPQNSAPVYSAGSIVTAQPYSGYGGPPNSPTTWTISSSNGTSVSNTSPNGWNLTLSGSTYTMTIPSGAAVGSYNWTYLVAGGASGALGQFNCVASAPSTGAKAIFFPNGSRITFTAPSVPTASTPTVACTVQGGAPYLVNWVYTSSSAWGQFVVTDAQRTQWVMAGASSTSQWILTQEIDRNGNAITFHYGFAPITMPEAPGPNYYGPGNILVDGFPLLTSITNAAGTTLLTLARAIGTGNVTSITDCYGRGVSYQEAAFTVDVNGQPASDGQTYQELTQVSQVAPASMTSPPSRWSFGYQDISNTEGEEEVPFLHTITVPSPTGSGTSQATLNYSATTDLVSSIVDGNGNTESFASTNATGGASYPSNYTTVTVSNTGTSPYSYTVGFDSNMSQTSETDGTGHATGTRAYSSPNDPYRPSSTQDGNGYTAQYTWDQYGNMLTKTPPSSAVRTPAVTTNTYVYTNFALGELTKTQTGGKTATSYAYYEPSGLPGTVTGPQPGTAGAAAIVLDAITYDALGNVTSTVMPGPNSTPAATTGSSGFSTYVTTAMNYTTDGSYSQSDAIGEPLTVTDPLGHTAHFRYAETVPYSSSAINRGHTVSMIDALGDETDATFNINDAPVTTVSPATGQSGSGRGSVDTVYLYDESGDTSGQEQYGPVASVKTYDEGDTSGPLRTVSYTYGLEGETKGVSGSAEPVTYTYDALYRLTALTDGGGHTTHYFYNAAGYLYQTAYPLSGATTAALAAGSSDTTTYTAYDGNGDLTGREDGNGTVTTYTYNDPENLLTDVHYTLPASPPAYISALADTGYVYDAYGRRASMTDATGSQSYSYDDGDMTLSDTTTYTGLSAKTVAYTYDPDGSRATMTLTGVSGGFSYSYDNAGRETGLTNPFSETTSWAYFANDWLQTQTLGGTASATYTYDARGQITDLKNVAASTTVSEYNMGTTGGYDGAGNRLGMACTGTDPGTVTYAYDGRNELTQETSNRTNAPYSDTQQYDGVTSGTSTGPGNPTLMRGTGHGYNADNQDTGNTYDGDGSPKVYKGTACRFDPEQRLTLDGSQANTYTGDGLRAQKQWSGGDTWFLYDGDDVLAEENSSGTITAVDTFGEAGLAWCHGRGNPDSGYLWDPMGDMAERVSVGGSVTASSASDGFGYQYPAGTGDPFAGMGGQFGYYRDQGTGEDGLFLLTHREYDNATGRFLTRDPMGYDGGVNLYGYCGDNPVNEKDAFGLSPEILAIPYSKSNEVLNIAVHMAALSHDQVSFNETPPGDCPQELYDRLTEQVNVLCHQLPVNLWETECDIKMDCPDLFKLYNDFLRCANARLNRETRCFNGGNEEHKYAIDKMLTQACLCHDLWVLKCCPKL
jgi:RHS repeat-associated protein